MAKCFLLALMMMALLASKAQHGVLLYPVGNLPSHWLLKRQGIGGGCNRKNSSECCKKGKMYPQYRCSPPITGQSTKAHMTINSFKEGGDGGAASECDDKFHSDREMVVALSTGWYNHGSRCPKNSRLNANGRSVLAKVVDECDSVFGCDANHDNQPPRPNNIVDASPAVWKALKIPKSKIGDFDIYYMVGCMI